MAYAVIDIETTGLHPGRHDRIVEVAGVRLGSDLKAVSEFSTLVNPERDIGPTHIHGIRTQDVLDAPKFMEIAGAVTELLQGAIVIGHNVRFDLRFIEAEFARANVDIPQIPFVDTMSLAVRAGSPTRRLEDACTFMGIDLRGHHAALNDARATSALFVRCIEQSGSHYINEWVENPCDPATVRWPRLEKRASPITRSQVAETVQGEETFITSIVRKLPASSATPGNWQAYYAVLDRALEDRRISEDEAEALSEVAIDAGLSGAELQEANESYVRDIIRVAQRDQVISEFESRDIQSVAKLLGCSQEVDRLIAEVSNSTDDAADRAVYDIPLTGRTICFTGALNAVVDGQRATRKMASDLAAEHGLTVVSSVTKELDYLVAADPDSMSGKAKKARKYGVRILAESVFWGLMEVDTE